MDFWFKNNAPEDSVIMIVRNKSDLNYKVESEVAKNFAEKNSCLFYEVSAKNGSNLNNVILLHSMINKYFLQS